MKKGDVYYRRKHLSDTIQTVELAGEDPEGEYMLKTIDQKTGLVVWINRCILDAKWKPMTTGIQTKLFGIDQTEKVKRIFNHRRDGKTT